MSVRFDAYARRAIERAMIEAEHRRHATLDTGHLLLGLVAPPDAPAVVALARLGVPADGLRAATARLLEAAQLAGARPTDEIAPATDELLLRAYQHSLERESSTVSDVDILVACVLDPTTTAGMTLRDLGVTAAGLVGATTAPRRVSPGNGTPEPAADGGAPRRTSGPHTIMFGGAPAPLGPSRSGIGYDSHRFEPGGPMILGGVAIPSEVRLVGHSDGDAIAHAVTDAVLGAACAGDIGEMFSDGDEANRGRDSIEMLRLAVERVRGRGFAVQQVDVTVIAEQPRIGPHRDAIRQRLADALGVPHDAVSVKGKTNEGMGWIGRGEGLACIAVASVVALLGE
ncbi:MAG: 2-C-methyl-D-erythritol 2,4-cyclodiphosphate synthase [Gemmatimonadaceae bacterium]